MATSYLPSGRIIPDGAIDGVNTVFTLPQAPLPINSLQLFLNGQLLPVGTQYDRSGLTPYTLSGSTITLLSPPQTGDELVSYFTYATTVSGGTAVNYKPSPIDLTTVAIVKNWLNTSGQASKSNDIEDANIQRCITAASRYWLWRTGRGSANWQTTQNSPFNQPIAYDEWYDGNGNQQLFLRNWPIISVQSVTDTGVAIQESSSPIGRGFMVPSEANQIVLHRERFCRGKRNVNVKYTAGFDVLSVTTEVQTVPSASLYTITVNNLPWLADAGVAYFSDGTPLTPVTTAPLQGQYFVQGGGSYLFNAADIGQQLLFSYTAAGTPEDVRMACTQMVAVNYKRREWIDQSSQSMANGAGTVAYRSWELPPEVVAVMNAYTRRAI